MTLIDNIKNIVPWYRSGSLGSQAEKKIGSFTLIEIPSRKSAKDIGDWRDAYKMADNPGSPQRYKLYEIYKDSVLDDDYGTASEKRKDGKTTPKCCLK